MTASARDRDPRTSHLAAESAERSGRAQGQRAACLNEVRRHPGRTSAEIAKGAGIDRYQAARRLPELRSAGLVKNGPERKCAVMGTVAMTWEPAEPRRICQLDLFQAEGIA